MIEVSQNFAAILRKIGQKTENTDILYFFANGNGLVGSVRLLNAPGASSTYPCTDLRPPRSTLLLVRPVRQFFSLFCSHPLLWLLFRRLVFLAPTGKLPLLLVDEDHPELYRFFCSFSTKSQISDMQRSVEKKQIFRSRRSYFSIENMQ